MQDQYKDYKPSSMVSLELGLFYFVWSHMNELKQSKYENVRQSSAMQTCSLIFRYEARGKSIASDKPLRH